MDWSRRVGVGVCRFVDVGGMLWCGHVLVFGCGGVLACNLRVFECEGVCGSGVCLGVQACASV